MKEYHIERNVEKARIKTYSSNINDIFKAALVNFDITLYLLLNEDEVKSDITSLTLDKYTPVITRNNTNYFNVIRRLQEHDIPSTVVAIYGAVKCTSDFEYINDYIDIVDDNYHFIIQENLHDYKTLRQVTAEEQSEREYAKILIVVLATLSELYNKHNFTHYDLNLDNIMLKEQNTVYKFNAYNGINTEFPVTISSKYSIKLCNMYNSYVTGCGVTNKKHHVYKRGFPMHDVYKLVMQSLYQMKYGTDKNNKLYRKIKWIQGIFSDNDDFRAGLGSDIYGVHYDLPIDTSISHMRYYDVLKWLNNNIGYRINDDHNKQKIKHDIKQLPYDVDAVKDFDEVTYTCTSKECLNTLNLDHVDFDTVTLDQVIKDLNLINDVFILNINYFINTPSFDKKKFFVMKEIVNEGTLYIIDVIDNYDTLYNRYKENNISAVYNENEEAFIIMLNNLKAHGNIDTSEVKEIIRMRFTSIVDKLNTEFNNYNIALSKLDDILNLCFINNIQGKHYIDIIPKKYDKTLALYHRRIDSLIKKSEHTHKVLIERLRKLVKQVVQ